MNLVKRDEFEVLKKLVQKLIIENQRLKKSSKSKKLRKKASFQRKKTKK